MRTPEKMAQTVDYLADNLRKFLRSGDKLIICFADSQPGDFSDLLAQAAKKLGVTVLIPEDLKWKTMRPVFFPMDSISALYGRMNLTETRWTRANGITVFA